MSFAFLLQPGGALFSGTVIRISLVFLFPAVPGLATAVLSGWRLTVLCILVPIIPDAAAELQDRSSLLCAVANALHFLPTPLEALCSIFVQSSLHWSTHFADCLVISASPRLFVFSIMCCHLGPRPMSRDHPQGFRVTFRTGAQVD